MSSIIILGTNKDAKNITVNNILQKFDLERDENNPDLLEITPEENKKSIGIAQVQLINKFISEKPYSHKSKAVIIEKGELLTTQAQNALLKNLEEHPNYLNIIIGAKTEKDVLETVLSRCKRINLKSEGEEKSSTKTFEEFCNLGVGERLDFVANLAKEDKEIILSTLEEWLFETRGKVWELGSEPVELLVKVKKDLENTNVNTKLALEYLAIGFGF